MKVLRSFRCEELDLIAWQAQATEAKLTLSEWVRRRCNAAGEVVVKPGMRIELQPVTAPDMAGKEVAVAQEATPKRRSCPHGLEPGWRCTLCGGIVK